MNLPDKNIEGYYNFLCAHEAHTYNFDYHSQMHSKYLNAYNTFIIRNELIKLLYPILKEKIKDSDLLPTMDVCFDLCWQFTRRNRFSGITTVNEEKCMSRLKPSKLHITFSLGIDSDELLQNRLTFGINPTIHNLLLVKRDLSNLDYDETVDPIKKELLELSKLTINDDSDLFDRWIEILEITKSLIKQFSHLKSKHLIDDKQKMNMERLLPDSLKTDKEMVSDLDKLNFIVSDLINQKNRKIKDITTDLRKELQSLASEIVSSIQLIHIRNEAKH